MSSQMISLLRQASRPRILVLGDLMLDRYVWGDVERISPEAPVPVLQVHRTEHRLGGAGSVASMLAALDAVPLLVAVVGDDQDGRIVSRLLEHTGIDNRILTDPRRPTTVKQRLLGRSYQRCPYHLLRVDYEDPTPIPPALKEALSSASADWIGDADLIVISDYDKGVCGNGLIAHIVELARFAGVRVVADPASGVDYRRYARCTCITPNRTEAGRASATTISSTGEALQVAQRLLGLDVESVALTLDRDGIAWADSAGNSRLFPARARSVADITGAGDMVISAIAYSLAAGADYTTAVELANYAAGLEVERLGVVPLARQELLAGLSSTPSRPAPRPPFEVRSTRQETIDVACG